MDLAYTAIDEIRNCLLASFFMNNFQLFILVLPLIIMVAETPLGAQTPSFKLDSKIYFEYYANLCLSC